MQVNPALATLIFKDPIKLHSLALTFELKSPTQLEIKRWFNAVKVAINHEINNNMFLISLLYTISILYQWEENIANPSVTQPSMIRKQVIGLSMGLPPTCIVLAAAGNILSLL